MAKKKTTGLAELANVNDTAIRELNELIGYYGLAGSKVLGRKEWEDFTADAAEAIRVIAAVSLTVILAVGSIEVAIRRYEDLEQYEACENLTRLCDRIVALHEKYLPSYNV